MNTQNPGNFPLSKVAFFESDKAPEVATREGFRFARLGFKLTKEMKAKNEAKRENFLALVQQLNPETDFGSVSGAALLVSICDDFQDAICKDVAEGDAEFSVLDSVESMAKYWNDKSRDSSGRKVTKESIGEYFMENLASFVIAAAAKKNELAKPETLERIAVGYCEMFQKLSGYAINHNENQCILMTRILEESKAEGEMADWLKAKIAKVAATFRITNEELENSI